MNYEVILANGLNNLSKLLIIYINFVFFILVKFARERANIDTYLFFQKKVIKEWV